MAGRPIQVPWHCCRSGDCCRGQSLVMTSAEQAELMAEAAVATRPLRWQPHPEESGLQVLLIGPEESCPFLGTDAAQVPLCRVWAHRPYNCRRFSCGRVDPPTEPFEAEVRDPAHGRTGCANLSDRLRDSLRFREWYRTYQRCAQRDWAEPHGWQWQHGRRVQDLKRGTIYLTKSGYPKEGNNILD